MSVKHFFLGVVLFLASMSGLSAGLVDVSKDLKGDLVSLDGKKVKRFDDAKLGEVKYLAIYYSAHWCPPCRKLTPDLVKWYNDFKPKHPNFELVFFSSDNDEKSMEEYMTGDAMPWPAVRFDKVKSNKLRSFSARGIPYMVVLDVAAGNRVLPTDEALKKGDGWVYPGQILKSVESLVSK